VRPGARGGVDDGVHALAMADDVGRVHGGRMGFVRRRIGVDGGRELLRVRGGERKRKEKRESKRK